MSACAIAGTIAISTLTAVAQSNHDNHGTLKKYVTLLAKKRPGDVQFSLSELAKLGVVSASRRQRKQSLDIQQTPYETAVISRNGLRFDKGIIVSGIAFQYRQSKSSPLVQTLSGVRFGFKRLHPPCVTMDRVTEIFGPINHFVRGLADNAGISFYRRTSWGKYVVTLMLGHDGNLPTGKLCASSLSVVFHDDENS
jgi:hypothetical protein